MQFRLHLLTMLFATLRDVTKIQARASALKKLKEDETMASLIERFGDYSWELNTPFATLARAISGQVVSGRAAKTAYKRLKEATGLEPQPIAEMPIDDLKTFGLNDRRAEYLRNAAEFASEGGLASIEKLDDEEVQKKLTSVKGIGPWTAHMFLIFCLGRLDVWPTEDFGVVNIAKELYGVEGKKELRELGERFSPYRSVAVWYMWALVVSRQRRGESGYRV